MYNALRKCTIDMTGMSIESHMHLCDKAILRQKYLETIHVAPIAQAYWERKYVGFSPNWGNVWNVSIFCSKEARVRTQQWKVLHNIWPTNVVLKRMRKVDCTHCTHCKEEVDDMGHFFYKCKKVHMLWRNIEKMCSVLEGRNVKLSETDVLFGYNVDQLQDSLMQNKLILIGKLCISKFKFGTYPNLVILFESECVIRCFKCVISTVTVTCTCVYIW